jgi:predicted HicB family RNase H-like nuclease
MEYRGYTGCVRYDAVERMFYGEVMDLADTITYEAVDEERLECAFRDAVDEYIAQCRACEEEPERPRASLPAAA